MEITVNGQLVECVTGSTLAELLDQMQIPLAGTAVACNDVVVRKAAYVTTVLQPGDRLEIIRAVAGG